MMSITDYKDGHYIELLRSGESFFSTLENTINEALHYIHFQTYMVEEDETGHRIINALINAAKRGVKIYLLVDDFGSGSFSRSFMKKITDAGILFRRFSPVYTSRGLQLRLRLHHKVVLVDGKTAIIGGINVANRYMGVKNEKEWLDFALLVKGPECVSVLNIIKKLWNKKFIAKNERSRERITSPEFIKDGVKIKVIQNNWYRRKIEILKNYRKAFKRSQKNIILVASYFLPGRNERRLLKNARKRGVDIKIMLAAESDVPMFKRATNFLYGFMLRNGIKIYEYLPTNVHAKVATADGLWSTIGSYNLNHLSDYGSIELNVSVMDVQFTQQFEKLLLEIMEKDCHQITFEDYMHRRTWLSSLADWFSYQIIRLLLRLMLPSHTIIKRKRIKTGNTTSIQHNFPN